MPKKTKKETVVKSSIHCIVIAACTLLLSKRYIVIIISYRPSKPIDNYTLPSIVAPVFETYEPKPPMMMIMIINWISRIKLNEYSILLRISGYPHSVYSGTTDYRPSFFISIFWNFTKALEFYWREKKLFSITFHIW